MALTRETSTSAVVARADTAITEAATAFALVSARAQDVTRASEDDFSVQEMEFMTLEERQQRAAEIVETARDAFARAETLQLLITDDAMTIADTHMDAFSDLMDDGKLAVSRLEAIEQARQSEDFEFFDQLAEPMIAELEALCSSLTDFFITEADALRPSAKL